MLRSDEKSRFILTRQSTDSALLRSDVKFRLDEERLDESKSTCKLTLESRDGTITSNENKAREEKPIQRLAE